MNDLNQLLKLLLENELEFLIVGGFAAVIHGSSHVTKDLDISMAMTPKNIRKLRDILKDAEPVHRMNPSNPLSFMDEPKNLDGLNNIYLKTKYGILDVVSLQPEVGSFEELYKRAAEVELFGHTCSVLDLDDLINVKSRMKRPKDIIVLEELLQIKKENN